MHIIFSRGKVISILIFFTTYLGLYIIYGTLQQIGYHVDNINDPLRQIDFPVDGTQFVLKLCASAGELNLS